jgi:CrcB protein
LTRPLKPSREKPTGQSAKQGLPDRKAPVGSRSHKFRDTAMLYAGVALGSMIGGVLRALASMASLGLLGPGFPAGTLFVNVLGSFIIGFYATLTGPDGRVFAGSRGRQFVMAGICGGFTTFSMFSLETFDLLRDARPLAAGLNVGISVTAWLAAVWLGHMAASRLNRLKGS